MGSRPLRQSCFPELTITGGACVMLALWLMTVPVRWVGAAVFAGTIHEMGHLICLRSMKIPVHRVKIGAFGAEMETAAMEPVQEFYAAVSGPAVGILLVLAQKILPRCALCALIQSLWNLIPVRPMDGGRALAALGRILQAGREKLVAEDTVSGYNDSD